MLTQPDGEEDDRDEEQRRRRGDRGPVLPALADEVKRVARKDEIFAQMYSFLANHPVEKQRLLDGGHLGRFIALAAAITQHPERRDAEKILQIQSERLPHGHAQYIFIDLVKLLRSRFDLTSARDREKLLVWAQEMPNKNEELQRRVREMR